MNFLDILVIKILFFNNLFLEEEERLKNLEEREKKL